MGVAHGRAESDRVCGEGGASLRISISDSTGSKFVFIVHLTVFRMKIATFTRLATKFTPEPRLSSYRVSSPQPVEFVLDLVPQSFSSAKLERLV